MSGYGSDVSTFSLGRRRAGGPNRIRDQLGCQRDRHRMRDTLWIECDLTELAQLIRRAVLQPFHRRNHGPLAF